MNQSYKVTYSVIIDSFVVENWFGHITPFNLKWEIKSLSNEQKNDIKHNIGAHIMQGVSNSYKELIIETINKRKITISKLKITDRSSNKGKSSGFRCIVLVDNLNFLCILLHIYKHSDKDNITKSEKNKLRNMLEHYVSSL